MVLSNLTLQLERKSSYGSDKESEQERPEGKGIEVFFKREGDFARISVRDHGVGIAADRVETIFHKGETTYGTGGEEGSGLGLQLCQDFARKNGGDAYVESVEGEGSTFSFTIPIKKEAWASFFCCYV